MSLPLPTFLPIRTLERCCLLPSPHSSTGKAGIVVPRPPSSIFLLYPPCKVVLIWPGSQENADTRKTDTHLAGVVQSPRSWVPWWSSGLAKACCAYTLPDNHQRGKYNTAEDMRGQVRSVRTGNILRWTYANSTHIRGEDKNLSERTRAWLGRGMKLVTSIIHVPMTSWMWPHSPLLRDQLHILPALLINYGTCFMHYLVFGLVFIISWKFRNVQSYME